MAGEKTPAPVPWRLMRPGTELHGARARRQTQETRRRVFEKNARLRFDSLGGPPSARAFRRMVNRCMGDVPMPPRTTMLPVNTLRQIQKLFPTHAAALDDWQRGFIQDQLARLDRWGDDIRLSEKQAAVLDKALTVMKKAAGADEGQA